MNWQPLLEADLCGVNELADRIHTGLPERPEVFQEKLRLFPLGCKALIMDGKIEAYGISHPWILGEIPPLDEFIHVLPLEPNCLYVHDVVVSPKLRGKQLAEKYIQLIKHTAHQINVNHIALVSVYGTNVLWSRFGFREEHSEWLSQKLISYGASAKYMVCPL